MASLAAAEKEVQSKAKEHIGTDDKLADADTLCVQ